MKKMSFTSLVESKLIALAAKYSDNLAGVRLTKSSLEMADSVLCHLTAIDGSCSVYGSLSFLQRLMEIKGWSNSKAKDPSAYWWIQPVAMEEQQAALARQGRL